MPACIEPGDPKPIAADWQTRLLQAGIVFIGCKAEVANNRRADTNKKQTAEGEHSVQFLANIPAYIHDRSPRESVSITEDSTYEGRCE